MEQRVSVVRTVRQRRPRLAERWSFCRGRKATARVTRSPILVIDSEPRTVLDSFGPFWASWEGPEVKSGFCASAFGEEPYKTKMEA